MPAFEFLENRQDGKTSLLLSGARWESSDRLAGNELIDYSLALKVERLVLNDQAFGPGRIGLELRRLDAESIARFKTEMQELSGREEALSPEDFNTLAGNAAIGMIGGAPGEIPGDRADWVQPGHSPGRRFGQSKDRVRRSESRPGAEPSADSGRPFRGM